MCYPKKHFQRLEDRVSHPLLTRNHIRFSLQRHRRQCVIFEGRQDMFPCKYGRQKKRKAKSVHRLTPADIDVVASLGDSLTSGVGSLAKNLLGLLNEYRGVSFSCGGLGEKNEIHPFFLFCMMKYTFYNPSRRLLLRIAR